MRAVTINITSYSMLCRSLLQCALVCTLCHYKLGRLIKFSEHYSFFCRLSICLFIHSFFFLLLPLCECACGCGDWVGVGLDRISPAGLLPYTGNLLGCSSGTFWNFQCHTLHRSTQNSRPTTRMKEIADTVAQVANPCMQPVHLFTITGYHTVNFLCTTCTTTRLLLLQWSKTVVPASKQVGRCLP